MAKHIQQLIADAISQQKALLAVLHDPDKVEINYLPDWLHNLELHGVDLVLIGGSLLTKHQFDETVAHIKANTNLPVVLFPGNSAQIHRDADALLLLSLISGRNPDLLIGKHVEAAQALKESGLELLPTGYMLVDGGRPTAASYMSNTFPLPANKPSLSATTALAGVQLGLRHIYMDAGSGADRPVPAELIKAVREEVDVPIWVGGGIRSAQDVRSAVQAGANVIVVGTALEEDGRNLEILTKAIRQPVEGGITVS